MYFADALHLGKSGESEKFATFDQRFIKAALRDGIEGVAEP